MASKLWIIIALVYVAECRIIKSTEEVLPEGIVEAIVKPNIDRLTFGDTTGKRIYRSSPVIPQPKKQDKEVPVIESRVAINGGVSACPTGYVRAGGFCFPDYD